MAAVLMLCSLVHETVLQGVARLARVPARAGHLLVRHLAQLLELQARPARICNVRITRNSEMITCELQNLPVRSPQHQDMLVAEMLAFQGEY